MRIKLVIIVFSALVIILLLQACISQMQQRSSIQRLASKFNTVASQSALEHKLYCEILTSGNPILPAKKQLEAMNELRRSEFLARGGSYTFEFSDPNADSIFAETSVGFDTNGKITSVSRVRRIGSAIDGKEITCKT